MKSQHIKFHSITFLLLLINLACSKSTYSPVDDMPNSIEAVTDVNVRTLSTKNTIEISWKNPDDAKLDKIEFILEQANGQGVKNVQLLDAKAAEVGKLIVQLNTNLDYMVSITALNKAGVRSEKVSKSIVAQKLLTWLPRADTLMKALVKNYLDGKPRDIWSSNFPQSSGYWDGAAVIWGHGGAFSGYTTFKKASYTVPSYKKNIEQLYDNRLLVGIDKFRNKRDGGPEAYAVYPGEGDERFYDDNIWVGLDMVHLYELTKDSKYLDRAKIVWQFVLSGADDVMGGGVYWKEGQKSKHTCSTFPAAVLGLSLYNATKDSKYLDQAKAWYDWGIRVFQDPNDYLFYDNVRLSDANNPNSTLITDKTKFSYNTGQPLQAASLLYSITKEAKYLTAAQQMAKAAYGRWFVPFRSYVLNESFQILEPGHVWFQAIMMRGFVELYLIDNNREYINAYEKTLNHAWLSPARNKSNNLINENFKGVTTQTSWELIHQGAILEMLSQLAQLEIEGK